LQKPSPKGPPHCNFKSKPLKVLGGKIYIKIKRCQEHIFTALMASGGGLTVIILCDLFNLSQTFVQA
jgi:hypothetical protein